MSVVIDTVFFSQNVLLGDLWSQVIKRSVVCIGAGLSFDCIYEAKCSSCKSVGLMCK